MHISALIFPSYSIYRSTSVYDFHMTRIMRGTYRYIALGIAFPLMSSSLWVVHKVDSGFGYHILK